MRPITAQLAQQVSLPPVDDFGRASVSRQDQAGKALPRKVVEPLMMVSGVTKGPVGMGRLVDSIGHGSKIGHWAAASNPECVHWRRK